MLLADLSKTAAAEHKASAQHAEGGVSRSTPTFATAACSHPLKRSCKTCSCSSCSPTCCFTENARSKNLKGVTSNALPTLGGAFFCTLSTSIASSFGLHPGLGEPPLLLLPFGFALVGPISLTNAHQLLASRTKGTHIEEPRSVCFTKQLAPGSEVSQVLHPERDACQELTTLKPILQTKTC